MKKRLAIYLVLLVILLASSWSLLRPGIFYTHDYIHGTRITEMARMLGDGQFPPRWSENFGYGYGMPLFQFYGPFPYIVGAALSSYISLEASVKVLFAITSLATLMGSYFLGRDMFGKSGGLVTAALITLAPYRAVNLYVRGAVSEAFGMMVFPWIIYFGLRSLEKKRFADVYLVISLLILLLSHNLSAMMFIPLSFVFLITIDLLKQQQLNVSINQAKKYLQLSGFYFLAFTISAFYTLPAFIEKNLTKVEQYIVGGYFDFRLHFVGFKQYFLDNWGYGGSTYGPQDSISFFLGYWQLFLLAVGVGLITAKILKKKINMQLRILLLILASFLLSLFMSHYKSESIWTLIEPLRYIQFPWRWLGISTFFLGLFGAGTLTLVKKRSLRTLVAVLAVLGSIAVNYKYFQPERYLDNSEEYYYEDAVTIRREMSSVLPDYIPSAASDQLEPTAEAFYFIEEGISVSGFDKNSHETKFTADSKEGGEIVLSRFIFPGWQAESNNNPLEIKSSDEGLILLNLSPGRQDIRVWYGHTQVRFISDLISVVGVGLLVFLIYAGLREKQHE